MPTASLLDPPRTKPVEIVNPLVSIIIPCSGMLEYTKLCVPSVLQHTRAPYELIFLDIGSLDGTAEFLAGLKIGARNIRIEIVRTQTDMGIRDACKDALGRVRGEYVVFLNNDTIVTRNWIEQLTGLANSSETVGMVGPMTNFAAEGQRVDEIPYRVGPRKGNRIHGSTERETLMDVSAVNEFALKFRDKFRKQCMQVERLQGFCVLVKRDVVRKLDTELQQWTDLRLFDSDILGTKVRQLGYALGVALDCYIHHFGTRVFAHGALGKQDSQPTTTP